MRRATRYLDYSARGVGRLLLASACASLTLVALACSSGGKVAGGCSRDPDCGDPLLFRCERETGECRCRANEACRDGEFCNTQGYCQAHVGCYETRDCPSGFFCDSSTNSCLAQGRCVADVHCALGEICDPAGGVCKPGCRSAGDCPLRQACLCTAKADDGSEVRVPCTCDGATDAEREQCAIGQCSSQTCLDDSYCAFGEACRTPAEGGLKQCQSDYDPRLRPYCDSCVSSPGKTTCGNGPNFCLYSTYGSYSYCGVDCSQGQPCPNGYSCANVIVVYTRTKCDPNNDQCSSPSHRSSQSCRGDSDCLPHGLCAKDPGAETGYCYGRCTSHEGAKESFCSCVVDDDCAQDTCDPMTRTCSITRQPCDLNGNGCRKIFCVDFGDRGGCHIGENCKPLEGLTCEDLRR